MSGDVKWAIFATLLVLVLATVASAYVGGMEGSEKGKLAVKAVEGGSEEYRDAYAASRLWPRELVWILAAIVTAFIWAGFALKVAGVFEKRERGVA